MKASYLTAETGRTSLSLRLRLVVLGLGVWVAVAGVGLRRGEAQTSTTLTVVVPSQIVAFSGEVDPAATATDHQQWRVPFTVRARTEDPVTVSLEFQDEKESPVRQSACQLKNGSLQCAAASVTDSGKKKETLTVSQATVTVSGT